MNQIIESLKFTCTSNGRSAAYNIQMVQVGDGLYQVNYQNGRIGSTLASGTKTETPVDLEKAKKVFEKEVKTRYSKDYVLDGSASASEGFQAPEIDKVKVDMNPQLLNDLEEADIESYLKDDNWIMQEKFDGERRPVRFFKDKEAEGGNRSGFKVALPKGIAGAANFNVEVDGEQIGDKLVIWEALVIEGFDSKKFPLGTRLYNLESIKDHFDPEYVIVCPTFKTEAEKRQAFNEIKARGGEGVVFKRIDAPYEAGRPNSGGTALRFKFWASATVTVLGLSKSGKRSVRVAVIGDDGQFVEMGNVTIPPNKDIPAEGALAEVRYLYAYPNGGDLFQPGYKGLRADKDIADHYRTLKFKVEMDFANIQKAA